MNNESLRYDILKELFNISVGKAASLLSEIINRKIVLTVPNIITINSSDFHLSHYLPSEMKDTLMVSSISFHNDLKGSANLIFPAKKMRTFINLCTNENDSNYDADLSLSDIDFDIIKEIGNIILNSIIGEASNFLGINLEYNLPEANLISHSTFCTIVSGEQYSHVLVLFITFLIDETEIEGVIVLNLTLKSLNELINYVDRIEKSLYE